MNKDFDFSPLTNHRHLIDLFTMQINMSWMFNPNPIQAYHRDLLDLVRAVQIADRFIARPKVADSKDTSSRYITITLPVRDLSRWDRPEVQDILIQALQFLTQDTWVVNFVQRTAHPKSDAAQMKRLDLEHLRGPRTFGLFSGGLDSVAGTALLLHSRPDHAHVTVSGLGKNLTELHNTTIESVEQDVKLSRSGQPYPLAGVRYETPVQRELIEQHFADQNPREDYSQRSRGFVFLGMGAAVAHQDDQNELFVFEHGVGGINLAYNDSLIGVDLTRAMHPYFIALMSRFLSTVFETRFTIRNPHWFQSKGQVLELLQAQGSAGIVAKSRSCDSHRNRDQPQEMSKEVPHCGGCSSCILRRLATHFAKVPDTKYIKDPILVLRGKVSPLPKSLNTYALMRTQYQTLQRVLQETPQKDQFIALLQAFPDLRLAYDGFRMLGYEDREVREGIVQLYTSYVSEWDAIYEEEV